MTVEPTARTNAEPPADGNTTLVVYGNPLDLTGGSWYQCQVGPYLLNATFLRNVEGRGAATEPSPQ